MRVKPKRPARTVAEPGLSLKKRDASPGMGSRGAEIAGDTCIADKPAEARTARRDPGSDAKSDLSHVPTLEHVPPDLPRRSPVPLILIGCIVFLLILILF